MSKLEVKKQSVLPGIIVELDENKHMDLCSLCEEYVHLDAEVHELKETLKKKRDLLRALELEIIQNAYEANITGDFFYRNLLFRRIRTEKIVVQHIAPSDIEQKQAKAYKQQYDEQQMERAWEEADEDLAFT